MIVEHHAKKQEEPSFDEQKERMLAQMREESLTVICLAYMYAKNFEETGVDITTRWATMEQQNKILQEVYNRGYKDALQKIKEDNSNTNSNHVNGGTRQDTVSEPHRNMVQPANAKNHGKGKGKRHRR